MNSDSVEYVTKTCAYITRGGSELLVFEGPGHDDLQIPKGTVEAGETPREALHREVIEESGLAALTRPRHLATDVWTRRERPPKRYVRHFYRAPVCEFRDAWTHTVTGAGEERGARYEFSWLDLRTDAADAAFALDLGDYLAALVGADDAAEAGEAGGARASAAADD